LFIGLHEGGGNIQWGSFVNLVFSAVIKLLEIAVSVVEFIVQICRFISFGNSCADITARLLDLVASGGTWQLSTTWFSQMALGG